ncbi:divalent-cation tolerance protein CutA [bacterium]|nr:divalent-cation tolerance protein CutA [bacterium]
MTVPNLKTARFISQTMVHEKLAACANILGSIQSVYWWDKKIQKSREVALILKTQTSLVKRVIKRVKLLHPYECPCVVALPIKDGNLAFLQWIASQTKV